jgi:hypothetical protein
MPQARRSIGRLAALDVEILAFSHFPHVTDRPSAQLRWLASRTSP